MLRLEPQPLMTGYLALCPPPRWDGGGGGCHYRCDERASTPWAISDGTMALALCKPTIRMRMAARAVLQRRDARESARGSALVSSVLRGGAEAATTRPDAACKPPPAPWRMRRGELPCRAS